MKAHDGRWDALVCGGGMSGSACALALAERGRRTLVVNSALDTLGLPAFGPLLVLGPDGIAALDRLPGALRQVLLETSCVTIPDELEDTRCGDPSGIGGHRGSVETPMAWSPGVSPARPCHGARENIDSSSTPVSSRPDTPRFLVVDRRALSIRLKLVLEETEGVELKQAVTVGVEGVGREGAAQGVIVRTAFDDRLSTRACIVAVGLGLQGRVQVGAQVLEGGRYGELPADLLWNELQHIAQEWQQDGAHDESTTWVHRTLPVGASVGGLGVDALDDVATRGRVGRSLAECWGLEPNDVEWVRLRPAARCACGTTRRPSGLLPSRFAREHPGVGNGVGFLEGPFEALSGGRTWAAVGVRSGTMVGRPVEDTDGVGRCGAVPLGGSGSKRCGEEGTLFGACHEWFVADGVATGEWYVSPGGDLGALEALGLRVSRPEHTVSGMVLLERPTNADGGTLRDTDALSSDGCATLDWHTSGAVERARMVRGLWIVGRAAGASTYLESLLSGACVGWRVADCLEIA